MNFPPLLHLGQNNAQHDRNAYPIVQKMASVKGVVHIKGRIMAGTHASDTSFSAVHICGWLELIARLADTLDGSFVCLFCKIVILP